MDFKEFIQLSYAAFGKNSKLFHKNIQNIFQLRKQSKMDIEIFEKINGNILYNTADINDEIEKFYITKFSDKGTKQNYVNKHKV